MAVKVNIEFIYIKNSELWAKNMKVSRYKQTHVVEKHDESRDKKLLLNRKEINKIEKLLKDKGTTIVPLEIFTLKNLCVKDENGKIVSPIIENIEIKNDGYCVTWSQLYWIQGYAVIDDSIYFIGLGEEGSYNVRDQVFHVLNGKGINEKVSREHFIEKMISISTKPILPLSENTFSDEIDIIMGYMLF